jgi:hypothetical protein
MIGIVPTTTTVDLQLRSTLSIPKPGPFIYDLRKPGIAPFPSQHCDHFTIVPVAGFILKTNHFVLGESLERLTLPIIPDVPTRRENRGEKLIRQMWLASRSR